MALLTAWLLVAVGAGMSVALWRHLPSNSMLEIVVVAMFALSWLAMPIAIGFAAGLICAFFWRPVAPLEKQKDWGFTVVLLCFLPLLLMGGGGLCVLVIMFAPALLAFYQGIEGGARWRYFLGQTNDWERDDNAD